MKKYIVCKHELYTYFGLSFLGSIAVSLIEVLRYYCFNDLFCVKLNYFMLGVEFGLWALVTMMMFFILLFGKTDRKRR